MNLQELITETTNNINELQGLLNDGGLSDMEKKELYWLRELHLKLESCRLTQIDIELVNCQKEILHLETICKLKGI